MEKMLLLTLLWQKVCMNWNKNKIHTNDMHLSVCSPQLTSVRHLRLRYCSTSTTQMLRRSHQPVLVLRRVSVTGAITALAGARLQFLEAHVRLLWRRLEVLQIRNGSINPLVLRQCCTITKPLVPVGLRKIGLQNMPLQNVRLQNVRIHS